MIVKSSRSFVGSSSLQSRARLPRQADEATSSRAADSSAVGTDNLSNYFYCQLPEINTVYIECSAPHSPASPLMSGWLGSCPRMFNIWPRNKTDLPGSEDNAGEPPRYLHQNGLFCRWKAPETPASTQPKQTKIQWYKNIWRD